MQQTNKQAVSKRLRANHMFSRQLNEGKNQTRPQRQQVNNIDGIDLDLWSRLKLSELASRRSISRLGKLIFKLSSCATVHRPTPVLHQHMQRRSAVGTTAAVSLGGGGAQPYSTASLRAITQSETPKLGKTLMQNRF